MGGGERAKQIFQERTNSATKKCWEKTPEKSAKSVFYIRKNTVTKKWGEKNAGNNFSSNTRIVRPKNVRKKIVGKKCKKAFFYIRTNIVTKKWGKKTRETIFSETHK